MKRKALIITALLCVLALLCTGCKYRIRISKVEDETESETQPPETESETQPTETTEPAPTETTTLDPLREAGVLYDSGRFRAVAMDKETVLRLYTDAMNNVKKRCPGFTKKT